MEKWPFLYQNDGLTPLEKCQFFNFLNVFFYSLERCFFVLEYRKRRFPGLYCLKKQLEKWPFLDQNRGLTPLKNCQFFDFFVLLFMLAQKGVFSFQNIVRYIFLCYIADKKKMEKWQFLVQNHGLTPLEKCQFFDFLKFLFFWPRKVFFRSTIS